jgi:predicted secreted hydrolase
LEDEAAKPLGFQITFFRTRTGVDDDNPSRFAAKQVLFAHAAVSEPTRGSLLSAERSARAGFGLAEAAEGSLDVVLEEWRLRKVNDRYHATLSADRFSFDLTFETTQPTLLQGERGFSQKGPEQSAASYYYSLPQLRASGTLVVDGVKRAVKGSAWFDHEWSSAIMDSEAAGWDWVGLNMHDGTAVMASRMRNRQNGSHWAAATWRSPGNATRTFKPEEVEWRAVRRWRSARTDVEYPVEWQVQLADRTLTLKPLMDDQEHDARGSTGTLYWEGAVRAYDERGLEVGKGYLEMTGYGRGARDEVMR